MKKCNCNFDYVMGVVAGSVVCALVMLLLLLDVCGSPMCAGLVAMFGLPLVAFLPVVLKGVHL